MNLGAILALAITGRTVRLELLQLSINKREEGRVRREGGKIERPDGDSFEER